MLQLLIKNGLCVREDGILPADIAVQDGKIVAIDRDIRLPAQKTFDAENRFVLPGLIDAHVHLPWPSARFDSVDDYGSGTTAAVCGGVTTTIEYVVPDEQGCLTPSLQKQMEAASTAAFSDYAFHCIITRVNPGVLGEMAEAVQKGVVSFKIYTAYTGFRLGDEDILTVLDAAGRIGAVVCFHAEDGLLIDYATRQLVEQGCTDVAYYPSAHPKEADLGATYRIISYAKHLNSRIHIVHVNTREGAQMVGAARRAGYRITGETCPQYLMFTEDVFRSGQPEPSTFVLAPSMRTEADRQGLWEALANDDLQMVASDHCPYTLAQKMAAQRDFRSIPGGIAGVETSLPLVHTHGVHQNRFPIERMVALMSTNPARIFNLYPQKGTIAVGSDADLVVFDPQTRWSIQAAKLHSRTDHSVYEDVPVVGKPAATILRGEVVALDGEIVAEKPNGRFVTRKVYRNGP